MNKATMDKAQARGNPTAILDAVLERKKGREKTCAFA